MNEVISNLYYCGINYIDSDEGTTIISCINENPYEHSTNENPYEHSTNENFYEHSTNGNFYEHSTNGNFYEHSTNGNFSNVICKEHYHLKIIDNENECILYHIKEICEIIDNSLRENKKIIIHCREGISRSPSIVIAYLIWKLNISIEQSLILINDIECCPNDGFIEQLEYWKENKEINLNRKYIQPFPIFKKIK